MSRDFPSIVVRGGNVELLLTSGKTIVAPKGYGMIQDLEGKSLDKCSLFIGPVIVTGVRVKRVSDEAQKWFGPDYAVKHAFVDVPEGKWNLVGHVKEILYFRPGEHEGDWRHEFSEAVPLFEQAGWWWLELPTDCVITWRGIERP